uniref:Uncharacterized protein n=1 Tax=Anopheles culicifacies TaxID=139723 RepID=A0A182M1H6_9DIPT
MSTAANDAADYEVGVPSAPEETFACFCTPAIRAATMVFICVCAGIETARAHHAGASSFGYCFEIISISGFTNAEEESACPRQEPRKRKAIVIGIASALGPAKPVMPDVLLPEGLYVL